MIANSIGPVSAASNTPLSNCPNCGAEGTTRGVRAEPQRIMLLRACRTCSHTWEVE